MSNTRPLRIVIFDGSFNTTPFINRLIMGLAEKGHQVYIFGFNNKLDKKIPKVTYVHLGSVSHTISLIWQSIVLSIKMLVLKFNGMPLLRTLQYCLNYEKLKLQHQNFNNAMTLVNPDILHVQWPSLLVFSEGLTTDLKTKTVLSLRGYHINVRAFIDRDNFNKLKASFSKVSGFHSVSKAISRQGDLIYNSEDKIDHVIYSGINLKQLVFSETYNRNSTLQLLSVGRAHWKKGYHYMMDACKLLLEHNISFHYKIIGVESNEELQFLIHDYGLEHHVSLIGKMKQKDLYQVMTQSDVFVLPSLEEGIANVVIESMALGVPVISTNAGGMEELVVPNETGWLVPSREPKALAKAIIDFNAMSISDIEQMRRQARKKVEQQHQIDNMINGMEALYLQCLHENNQNQHNP